MLNLSSSRMVHFFCCYVLSMFAAVRAVTISRPNWNVRLHLESHDRNQCYYTYAALLYVWFGSLQQVSGYILKL